MRVNENKMNSILKIKQNLQHIDKSKYTIYTSITAKMYMYMYMYCDYLYEGAQISAVSIMTVSD